MNRKRTVRFLLAVFLCAIPMRVFAAWEPTVTFTKEETLQYNADEGEAVSLGTSFYNIKPGEKREQRILLQNESDKTVHFYMDVAAVRELEAAHQAGGGVFRIQMRIGEEVLYDSSVGGSYREQDKVMEEKRGILELNDDMDGRLYLCTLAKGRTEELVLSLQAEGETVTNCDTGYANATGELEFHFQVVVEEAEKTADRIEHRTQTNTRIQEKVITEKGEPVIEVIPLVKQVIKAVQTGDEARLWESVFLLILGIAVLIAALCGRKKKTVLALFAGLILAGLMVQPVKAEGKTYTVTFRAGNAGKFYGEYENEKGTVEQDEAGHYIKLTLPAGTCLEKKDFPNVMDIQTEGDYYMKDFSENAVVTKNLEYVVPYGMLNEGVSYTVSFVEEKTKLQAAAQRTQKAENGSEVICSAKEINGYLLLSPQSQTIYLNAENPEENQIIFYYRRAESEEESGKVTVVTDAAERTEEVRRREYIPGDKQVVYKEEEQVIYRQADVQGEVRRDEKTAEEAEAENAEEGQTTRPEAGQEGQEEQKDEEKAFHAAELTTEEEQRKDGNQNTVAASAAIGALILGAGGYGVLQYRKRRGKTK